MVTARQVTVPTLCLALLGHLTQVLGKAELNFLKASVKIGCDILTIVNQQKFGVFSLKKEGRLF